MSEEKSKVSEGKSKVSEEKSLDDNIERFLIVWKEYSVELMLYIETDSSHAAHRNSRSMHDRAEFLLSASKSIRKLIFELGEENLDVTRIYHWSALKFKFSMINDIGFLTPFSYLSFWVSFPHIRQLVTKHGFREALLVADYFIEAILFKYPLLEQKYHEHEISRGDEEEKRLRQYAARQYATFS